ncbi:MAG: 4Fe-4S dicluster domain-containing protein [Deltaproteobacteria bacterium]|jgi:heterodisulfide reductase subunit C/nitrate reductase gamma subunit|nr:4Fe-4S dicluster domain-containing protein [Deltaproteobacteria bacterium]
MFNFLLYSALIIFLLGLFYRISRWFTQKFGEVGQNLTAPQRVTSAAKGIVRILFSSKILLVLKALLVDVLLQARVFKEDFLRWLAHMLIFYGFMLLLMMHALDSEITELLFSDYYPTVNPFFLLRDLFGAMVLVGVAMASIRRYLTKPRRLRTGPRDHYAIIILAVIMLSGIGLIGLKITSHSEFMIMVEDYAGLDDEEEIQALETVWVKDFGLVSPNIQPPFDEDLLSAGQEVHESSCLDCHASAQWAFTGYATAKIIQPIAIWLDEIGGVTILWYIHFIACFAGLAYLPFSKMFHIICTPLSLIANQVMDPGHSAPANVLTRQIMELDACTHCGSCSLNCSAAMIYEAIGNENILPSEKIACLKKMVAGKQLDPGQLKAIAEGVYLCTNCDRCTVRCPSGIRLKELWYTVREELITSGPPLPSVLTPFSFARGLVVQPEIEAPDYDSPLARARQAVAGQFAELMKTDDAISLNAPPPEVRRPELKDNTFSHCFSCQSCTSVCPVVGNYERPEERLGLLPHQIMCCLGLGLTAVAGGAKMIWDCLTCYQCQENCPQQVAVCDLLYDLKNDAVADIN